MDGIVEWIRGIAQGDDLQRWAIAVVIVIITAVASALATRLIKRITSSDGVPLPSSSEGPKFHA